MEQHLLTNGPLLNKDGSLMEAGYAFSLVKEYNRKAIKGNKTRIKEWDYYYVGDENYGIALTIDDNSYMGLVSVSVLDFSKKIESTKSYIFWLPFGETNLPSSSQTGNTFKEGKKYSMFFGVKNGKRHLCCSMKNVAKKTDFSCDITLEPTTPHTMVIATPFNKKRRFYYNQKINLMKARGYFKFGSLNYQFKDKAYGLLDWGRGMWTYSNTWYWSSLNSEMDGHRVGFNLGYGFGDTSAASENMLFYDNEVYKLDDVTFNIPQKDGMDDYLSPWTFTSKKGDINLTFRPIIDRKSDTDAILIRSNQHQVFGYFSGTIKAEHKEIKIDNLLGFAEKVKNRW